MPGANGRAVVTAHAPDFKGIAVVNSEFKKIRMSDYKGKYLVLLFYPLDFSYVCPTEIVSFSERAHEFRSVNTELVAVSTDSHFSHLAWVKTPRKVGGVGDIGIPLLSDKSLAISKSYGVLKEDEGLAFRALFIIDSKGIIRQITVSDSNIGRSVDETLRVVQALQIVEKYGDVCPADWMPGDDTVKADPQGSKEYFHKHR